MSECKWSKASTCGAWLLLRVPVCGIWGSRCWAILVATALHSVSVFPVCSWYSFCAVPKAPSCSAGYSISYLTSPKSCYFCLPSVLTVYIFSLGLKTYLISGQKVKEPHCSCSQALLPSLEAGDGARMQAAPSAENTADSTKALKHVEKPKVSACFRELRLRPERGVDGETSPVCF